ncbi:MAG: carboxypeptidase regulatory-like domain-containing protein [Bacteroidales bacterium]|nr:carboxypeptidase regulatory-like domain-containing protein [Bacteroidales bacterium]
MTKFLKALVAVLATILCVSPAFAQVTTSSVSGIVTDDSGAPLEGSVIIAVHTPTGSQYYAVANSAGQYFINGMRAGVLTKLRCPSSEWRLSVTRTSPSSSVKPMKSMPP